MADDIGAAIGKAMPPRQTDWPRQWLMTDERLRDLWAAIQTYVDRERRYGGAVDAPTA